MTAALILATTAGIMLVSIYDLLLTSRHKDVREDEYNIDIDMADDHFLEDGTSTFDLSSCSNNQNQNQVRNICRIVSTSFALMPRHFCAKG